MLQNAYFVAKIGADTAENEQHSADETPAARRFVGRHAARAALRGKADFVAAWFEQQGVTSVQWVGFCPELSVASISIYLRFQ